MIDEYVRFTCVCVLVVIIEINIYSAFHSHTFHIPLTPSCLNHEWCSVFQVLAVVVRTGFSTAKGELVRSILYPRPLDFKFYKDAMKFIIFLFFIASIGMSYSVYIYIQHKVSYAYLIVLIVLFDLWIFLQHVNFLFLWHLLSSRRNSWAMWFVMHRLLLSKP